MPATRIAPIGGSSTNETWPTATATIPAIMLVRARTGRPVDRATTMIAATPNARSHTRTATPNGSP
ncbi:MAG: hypothetical protein E6K19_01785 [Methanobacteriota archaeon]|nr:MAG: hypothetical protein E6K19_01785 [Euryarchaeota archaeon]